MSVECSFLVDTILFYFYYLQLRWNDDQQSGVTDEQDRVLRKDPHGFGSISRLKSVKPIIAAVNGGAYGGGMEMVLNCDIVIAASDAKFALPEVKRSVVAVQGGTYLFIYFPFLVFLPLSLASSLAAYGIPSL